MKSNRVSFKKKELSCLLLTCVSLSSGVAYGKIEINTGVRHIDNPVLLESTNPLSDETDLSTTVGVDVFLERETQIFTTFVDYSAQSTRYRDDFLIDRDDITGVSSFTWKATPEVFVWNLANTRSMQEIDITAPDTPNNREVVSITSTGPRFEFPFGLDNKVNLELDYALADYEETSFGDQVRKSAYLSISRSITNQLIGSVNATVLDVEFDDDASLDYNSSKYSVMASFVTPSTNATLEVGETEVERESDTSGSNLFLDLNISYTPNSRSTFTLTYTESVEDQLSNLLASGQSGIGNSGGGGLNNYDFFEQTRKGLSYRYTTDDDYSVQLTYNDDHRKPENGLDEEEIETILAELTIPISLRFDVSVFVNHAEYEFVQTGGEQKRDALGITSRYQLNDRLRLELSFTDLKQESNMAFSDYDSWEAFFGVTYVLQQ